MKQGSNNKTEKENSISPKESNWVYAVPNIITGVRIFLIPIFIGFLAYPSDSNRLIASYIFAFACFTDWLDGYLARAYSAESDFGKLSDPLADKILVMSAFVMIVAFPEPPHVPAWLIVLLLAREMAITGLRSLALLKGIVISASNIAKYKTAFTMASIFFILKQKPISLILFDTSYFQIGMFFLWIALVFSIWSGVEYGFKVYALLNKDSGNSKNNF